MTQIARWLLCATAALMPLYIVRWRVGPVPTTLLEALILLTLVAGVLAIVRREAPLPGRTHLDIPIALFLVAGVIGIFVPPDHRGAAGVFRAYLAEPIAVYYVALALLTASAAVDLLLLFWAAGAVLFAAGQVVVLAHAYLGHSLVPGHVASILAINPNSVALYLEPLIGVAAGIALFSSGMRRQLAVAAGAVMVAGDLATLSRGGLLALAALALAAVFTLRSVRARVAILVAAVTAAGLLIDLPVIGPRLRHAIDPGTGTLDIRGDIWAATARMLRDRPVFGAGINAYQSTMKPYRKPYPNLSPEPYPHNIFLTSWTELGLLGLAAFSYILGALIVVPLRAFSKAGDSTRPLLWGTGVAFVMVLAHGLVDSPYWKNDLSLEFWLLAAIQVVTLRARAPK